MEANSPVIYILADEKRYVIGLTTRLEMEVSFYLDQEV